MADKPATEALAEAWASFNPTHHDAYVRERDHRIPLTDATCTGHYAGYLVEAEELTERLLARGFKIVAATPEEVAAVRPFTAAAPAPRPASR